VSEARAAYDKLAQGGDGAAHGAEDETGFEVEDADEIGAVAEWDEAA
jgi:hypothetical protein